MMTFIARMQVKPGAEERFEDLARQLTAEVRAAEPDTLAYEFFRLPGTERGYAVFESFASEAAEEAHRDTEHFHRLAPALLECLDGTYEREFLEHLD